MPSATLPSPRRLLLLTADYPPHPWSGIGRAVEAQARALARRGHDVHVLVAGPSESRQPQERAAGEPVVHRLTRQRFPVDAASFDVIHLHSLSLGALGLELRRRFGVPLACTVHGLVHHELPPGPRARQASTLQKHLLTASDAVIFLSRAEEEAGRTFVPAVAGRCRVIPNGLADDAIRADEPDERRRDGPIVFAGRFAHSKGIDRFARLVPDLLTFHQPGVVLAGGHGDAAGQAVAAAVTRRFPSACRSPGWLDRRALGHLFTAAALVVVPSRYEPFGLVALEAMARGAPVLAAAVGGLREVVTASSGSRRLADSAPDVWLRTARDLLGDPHAGRRGPDFVRQHFSIASVAERLEREIYDPCRQRERR